MKPPRFEYHAPRALDEALVLLAHQGERAKVLAGGQSLIPLLNFRSLIPRRWSTSTASATSRMSA